MASKEELKLIISGESQGAEQALQKSAKQVEATGKALKSGSTDATALSAAMNEATRSAGELGDGAEAADRMLQEMDASTRELMNDLESLSSRAEQSARSLDDVGGSSKKTSGAFGGIKSMALPAGVAVVGLGLAFEAVTASAEAYFAQTEEGREQWEQLQEKGDELKGKLFELVAGTDDSSEAFEVLSDVMDSVISIVDGVMTVLQPLVDLLRVTLVGAIKLVGGAFELFRSDSEQTEASLVSLQDEAHNTTLEFRALSEQINDALRGDPVQQLQHAQKAFDDFRSQVVREELDRQLEQFGADPSSPEAQAAREQAIGQYAERGYQGGSITSTDTVPRTQGTGTEVNRQFTFQLDSIGTMLANAGEDTTAAAAAYSAALLDAADAVDPLDPRDMIPDGTDRPEPVRARSGGGGGASSSSAPAFGDLSAQTDEFLVSFRSALGEALGGALVSALTGQGTGSELQLLEDHAQEAARVFNQAVGDSPIAAFEDLIPPSVLDAAAELRESERGLAEYAEAQLDAHLASVDAMNEQARIAKERAASLSQFNAGAGTSFGAGDLDAKGGLDGAALADSLELPRDRAGELADMFGEMTEKSAELFALWRDEGTFALAASFDVSLERAAEFQQEMDSIRTGTLATLESAGVDAMSAIGEAMGGMGDQGEDLKNSFKAVFGDIIGALGNVAFTAALTYAGMGQYGAAAALIVAGIAAKALAAKLGAQSEGGGAGAGAAETQQQQQQREPAQQTFLIQERAYSDPRREARDYDRTTSNTEAYGLDGAREYA